MSNEDFTLNDFFKTDLPRPDHPDFWKLSSIVLDLDASMTEGIQRGEEPDVVLAKKMNEVGDSYSLTYMATQRAFRMHGVKTMLELMQNMDEVLKTSLVYMEAMIVGARLRGEE